MQNNNNENLRIELLPAQDSREAKKALKAAEKAAKKERRAYRAANYTTTNTSGGEPIEGVEQVKTFVKKSVSVTLRYFLAKLLSSLLITVGCTVVFWLLGIPLALVWGLLAGIGNAIPVFGQWIGMGLAIGGVWITMQDWKYALYALITLIVLQILEEFVFEPLIVGKSTSIKPILIIIIMLLAGAFCGFWGIVFAVPAAACVKLAYEIFWLKKKD